MPIPGVQTEMGSFICLLDVLVRNYMYDLRFSNAFGFVQNSPILSLSAEYYNVDQN